MSLLRAKWVVLLVSTLGGGALALTFSLLITPVYEARVQFYVTVAGGDTAAAAYQGSLGAQQRVQSYAALVESTDIADRVLAEAQVDSSAKNLVQAVTANADPNTVLLEVTITDSDPQRATQLAKGYGQVLPEVINRLETPDGGGPALAKLTVTNPPTLPEEPIEPRTEQNLAMGLALGLLIGAGAIIFTNSLDRTVKSAAQLEAITGKPVVGAIPYRPRNERGGKNAHTVQFREGHSPSAEAFRRLRTNLQFLNVDNPPKTFVLTSPVATEGKSETAVNLGLVLAEAGNKVLIVEADLRRPRAVGYLSASENVGITNILTGQASFEDVVQETAYEGVDLLGCGPLPPNPSELLASDTAQRLIEELGNTYDYVVIDSPPLLPVTDAALLARITDGALLVVRSNRTATEQVSTAVDNLAKADAELLGVITVANSSTKRGSAEYYESYYYASERAEKR